MRILPPSRKIRGSGRAGGGFTLIEILLAISIATGLLIVAMIFYRQAAELRRQILQESERLAAVRLVMDRLAVDLRSARVGQVAGEEFRGDEGSLSFVTSTVALPVAGNGPGSVVGGADVLRVTFSPVISREGTNQSVAGFLRREEPVGVAARGGSWGGTGAGRLGDLVEIPSAPVIPTTDHIRFARFRYWDGAAWQTGWTNSAPPPGVEMILGMEPPAAEDDSLETYPFEQFRRVVAVPSGQASSSKIGSVGEFPAAL